MSTASLAMVTIDVADASAAAQFYSDLLGWEKMYDADGYAMVQGPGVRLGFGSTPDLKAPSWPDDGHKQFHLDLASDDIEATAKRAVELGATKPDEQPGEGQWTVLIDPGGHPFCITNAANW
ncbi:VOC family protein [Calidifontibacter sp. DB0510]|uniref:VOC family protein n=1 Tax=Metallococcus carri TaxID=1656884 RepID=A0A967AYQ7_9MICO|nr:VOC family protein [Metallococcus carri]NHN54275.1 VOC family protein [Metallococcus carri]NOP36885.1 VOC family protein [Calidifontibacter sp. DB2511S]